MLLPVNGAQQYGVTVQAGQPDAQGCVWRATVVSHVPDERNALRHNVYVNVQDETGRDLRGIGLRLVWGWEGQRADEAAPPVTFDKPKGEWGANIAMFTGQRVWCRIEGGASDTVRGLHTGHASEGDGTGYGHHSFEIVFQRVSAAVAPPVTGDDDMTRADWARRVTLLVAELQQVAQFLAGDQVRMGGYDSSNDSNNTGERHE